VPPNVKTIELSNLDKDEEVIQGEPQQPKMKLL